MLAPLLWLCCWRRRPATTCTTGWSTWAGGAATRWLVENPDTVTEVLGERAPWWAPTGSTTQ